MTSRRPATLGMLMLAALLAACAATPPKDATPPAQDPTADCPQTQFMTPFGEEKDGGIGGTGREEAPCR
ncbi:MAG: hypothetical protein AAGC92_07895 [Pseudomonadota bacterium]